ncbi:hypothetical protein IL992_11870 [Microbispora sp. NEAU-D428]|uniref:hypothetical protein n=1 Tax=Microbispora sitophila TaxID=2771537 RepID=UPI00186820D5|nr:hypothetical protein [Microbispora sitophila]MBE3009883.1 hypothetical protein [Microbispora sitophila]
MNSAAEGDAEEAETRALRFALFGILFSMAVLLTSCGWVVDLYRPPLGPGEPAAVDGDTPLAVMLVSGLAVLFAVLAALLMRRSRMALVLCVVLVAVSLIRIRQADAAADEYAACAYPSAGRTPPEWCARR